MGAHGCHSSHCCIVPGCHVSLYNFEFGEGGDRPIYVIAWVPRQKIRLPRPGIPPRSGRDTATLPSQPQSHNVIRGTPACPWHPPYFYP
jgi:hypothetical protein